jgi:hypothetical protein
MEAQTVVQPVESHGDAVRCQRAAIAVDDHAVFQYSASLRHEARPAPFAIACRSAPEARYGPCWLRSQVGHRHRPGPRHRTPSTTSDWRSPSLGDRPARTKEPLPSCACLPATSASTRSICVSVRTLACLPKPKVCTNDDGSPLRPHTPTHYRKRLAKRLGLPVIRFHDLRHACATHMPVLGINPKVASEKLGHSDVRDHVGIYSHVLPGIQENAAALVHQQLRAEIDKAKANN